MRSTRPLAFQIGKRANARRQRHTRVGGMELIEVDPLHTKRAAAVFDRRGQVFRPAVRHPAPARARQAALGGDDDGGSIARPARQGASDEPFVVTAFVVRPAIRVRGVEEGDAGIERRMENGNRGVLVAVDARSRAACIPEPGAGCRSPRLLLHFLLRAVALSPSFPGGIRVFFDSCAIVRLRFACRAALLMLRGAAPR